MPEPPKIRGLRVVIARYADPWPWVECHFHDAAGRLWTIREKAPVVTDEDISESTELPIDAVLHCVEVTRRTDESGRQLVIIDTELPFDIEAPDGTHKFEVLAGQLQDIPPIGRVTPPPPPLRIADIEHTLVSPATPPKEFAAALDRLLGHLLPETVTDGVLLERVENSDQRIVATGIAFLIEQTVEPLRIELNLDSSRTAVESGALHFGDTSTTHSHNKLSRKILANPDVEFAWRYTWHRTGGGWGS